jgi:predicted component of type VI protein secretion system
VGIAVTRLLLESGGERREINVAGSLTVGRAQTAGVYLDDKTLSREHTKFYVENGKLFVRDLESKNGTYLNGQLVRNTQPLKPGDRIKVGVATFTVVGDDAARPAVSAPPQAPRHHVPPPTVTAPTAPARARQALGGPSWFTVFIYRVILVSVIVVVTVISKGIFQSLIRGK